MRFLFAKILIDLDGTNLEGLKVYSLYKMQLMPAFQGVATSKLGVNQCHVKYRVTIMIL